MRLPGPLRRELQRQASPRSHLPSLGSRCPPAHFRISSPSPGVTRADSGASTHPRSPAPSRVESQEPRNKATIQREEASLATERLVNLAVSAQVCPSAFLNWCFVSVLTLAKCTWDKTYHPDRFEACGSAVLSIRALSSPPSSSISGTLNLQNGTSIPAKQ